MLLGSPGNPRRDGGDGEHAVSPSPRDTERPTAGARGLHRPARPTRTGRSVLSALRSRPWIRGAIPREGECWSRGTTFILTGYPAVSTSRRWGTPTAPCRARTQGYRSPFMMRSSSSSLSRLSVVASHVERILSRSRESSAARISTAGPALALTYACASPTSSNMAT